MLLNDVYEYNQHFVAMMNIINAARLNPPENGHKHHIIPQCWYRYNGIDVDNSNENMVLLTVDDHIKIHQLMIMCAKDIVLKHKLMWVIRLLAKGFGTFDGCHHTEDTKKKMSAIAKKRLANTDKRTRYWKGKTFSDEHRQNLSDAHKGKHASEETRNKMSLIHKGKPSGTKGKTWKTIDGKRVYERGQS